MVVATRISIPDCLTLLERQEPPPCGGSAASSSSVRIRCTLSRTYSSRKLGGGSQAVDDIRDNPVTDEQTFFVYDSSVFLRYEETRRVVHGAAAGRRHLNRQLDLPLRPRGDPCRHGQVRAAG
ncbi:unnamed protein product [Urochloa humidicola]